MNYIDIILIALLAYSAYRGFKNGVFIEMASLAALIFGIWGALKFSDFTAGKLVEWFDMTSKYLGVMAFAITFVVIVIAVHFIANVLDKLLKAVALGFLVRILGVVFAVVKNALILSIILTILNTIDSRSHFLPEEQLESSLLYGPVSDLAPMIFPMIDPDRWMDRLENSGAGKQGISA